MDSNINCAILNLPQNYSDTYLSTRNNPCLIANLAFSNSFFAGKSINGVNPNQIEVTRMKKPGLGPGLSK